MAAPLPAKGATMASVHDVAAYILDKQGKMTAMKLQKLLYYSQAWSLVWDEKPLFKARIEAWANGPVIPEVYQHHRGSFYVVPKWKFGDGDRLNVQERETVDAVLTFYGDKPSQWLSDLTHAEAPWKNAREGFADGAQCSVEIPIAAMAEYYATLASAKA
jgi:uncharacterized phage-associated protein